MDEFNADEIIDYSSIHNDIEFTDKCIQLIEFKGKHFELNKQTLDLIKSIEEEVIVVTIIGKAKTGTSLLLNLLLNNNNASPVGSNNQQLTKGIWIYGNPITMGKSKIIFIDAEGLSSSNNFNPKIFTLLVMISSLFIYNTNTNINENGISELGIIKEMVNSFSTNTKIDKDVFITESTPKFIISLRDFNSPKIDTDTGKEISSKEYLDLCLRKKLANNSNENNLLRETLIKYFPDRDCITFPTPVDDESQFKNLNDLNLDEFTQDFQNQIELLKNKIFKKLNSKKIKGKKLNGFSLANFIEEWINSINIEGVINLSKIWDQLINKDIDYFYEKAINNYIQNTKRISGAIEQEDIIKSFYSNKLEAMMKYNQIFNFNSDTLNNSQYMAIYNEQKRKLETEISKYETKISDENYKESQIHCKQVLQKSFEKMDIKIKENYYNSKTCDEYLKNHEVFLNSYLINSKGPQKVKILIDFLSENKSEFMKQFINELEKENSSRLDEINIQLKDSENNKIEAEFKNKELNEVTQLNNQKINDLNSDLEKKKREIVDLSERVRLLEMDISNRRESIINKEKKQPF